MSVVNIPMQVSATNDKLESIGDMQLLRKGTNETDTFRSTGEITFHSPYVFSVEAGRTGLDERAVPVIAADLVSVSELDVLTVENSKKMLTAVDAALVELTWNALTLVRRCPGWNIPLTICPILL